MRRIKPSLIHVFVAIYIRRVVYLSQSNVSSKQGWMGAPNLVLSLNVVSGKVCLPTRSRI